MARTSCCSKRCTSVARPLRGAALVGATRGDRGGDAGGGAKAVAAGAADGTKTCVVGAAKTGVADAAKTGIADAAKTGVDGNVAGVAVLFVSPALSVAAAGAALRPVDSWYCLSCIRGMRSAGPSKARHVRTLCLAICSLCCLTSSETSALLMAGRPSAPAEPPGSTRRRAPCAPAAAQRSDQQRPPRRQQTKRETDGKPTQGLH